MGRYSKAEVGPRASFDPGQAAARVNLEPAFYRANPLTAGQVHALNYGLLQCNINELRIDGTY
jgi:hypothetical protein